MSIRERDMYHPIENTGPFAAETFYYEVRIGDWAASRKKIDLVILRNKRLISIEAKICNWRKALQQAYSNLYVSDYSYVALWHKAVPNIDEDIFANLGIGVLAVSGSLGEMTNGLCNEILKAKKSNLIVQKCNAYVKNECKLQEANRTG